VALVWRATFARPKAIGAMVAAVKALKIDAYRLLI
jgi:hypothetical protein